ncbi:MAG: PspC domain-containing protein [Alistipes sp.]
MNEVKKCSISGVSFTLDTDAYDALKAYLNTLKATYGESADGIEIVADIEARIAELILSTQDNARIVEKPLIANIIAQMGSVEDITSEYTEESDHKEPRIPRRLYRDAENAKLGGVCAGIAKYFDVDTVWVRLTLFLPLFLTMFGGIVQIYWLPSIGGNLFGIFILCYLVMWFAIPVARTARQKLEMNGEKITAQSIHEQTISSTDMDSRAKPIVANVVSVFGQVVLICLKIFIGFIVFALILVACALIIGLFSVLIGGPEIVSMGGLHLTTLWVPILGILIAFIPVLMLIYVLMCLIASRKPGGKTILVIFLLWIATIIACASVAIHENVGSQIFSEKRSEMERIMKTEFVINDDTTSMAKMMNDETISAIGEQVEATIDEDGHTMHISVPSKNIDITVDKNTASVKVSDTEATKKD